MKRTRFTEEQIIGILKEAEVGAKTAELARRHGVSEATIYNWKAKYGGLEVSEARRPELLMAKREHVSLDQRLWLIPYGKTGKARRGRDGTSSK